MHPETDELPVDELHVYTPDGQDVHEVAPAEDE